MVIHHWLVIQGGPLMNIQWALMNSEPLSKLNGESWGIITNINIEYDC